MADLPSWARKGDKVICVNAEWLTPASAGERYPIKGDIYTIREVVLDGPFVTLRLEEIVNPIRDLRSAYGMRKRTECTFDIARFRPLVENASDSEVEATLYRKRKAQKNQHIPHLGTVS